MIQGDVLYVVILKKEGKVREDSEGREVLRQ